MGSETSKHEVRSAHGAFDAACAGLGLNATTYVLNRDWKAKNVIVSHLQEMGQTRFVNMTHKYAESAMSVVLYAGDGIVTKVMNDCDYDKSSTIYNLPAITSERVGTEDNKFVINTYPWLSKGFVSRDDIEELRTKMKTVGLNFATNDDEPRNIHMMPDKNNTLVGIDASMYTSAYNGETSSPELEAAWKQYVETVFPIYKSREIPRQTNETNFQFRSIHDRESGIVGFDSDRFLDLGKDPILKAVEKLSDANQSIWTKLFGSWMPSPHDSHEPT